MTKNQHWNNWARKNPRAAKNTMLKKLFGITIDQYEAKLAEQNGVCAICHMPETVKTNKGKLKALAVDHNKVSGKIRGLLCQKCNQAFGLLQEEITNMKSMIDYAKEHNGTV